MIVVRIGKHGAVVLGMAHPDSWSQFTIAWGVFFPSR